MTTTISPLITDRYFFLVGVNNVFLAFLSIDEDVTSCSSRNSGKGPPEPEFIGDLRGAPNQGRHPHPLEIGAKQRDQ